MFSLIITIVSIALVAALAIATIYYGGESQRQGKTKATAATLVNQAVQIAAAGAVASAQGPGWPTGRPAFSQPFLAGMPVPPKQAYFAGTPSADDWVYYQGGGSAHHFILDRKISREVCMEVNRSQSLIGIPAAWDGKSIIQCFGPSEPYTFFYDPPGNTPAQNAAALDKSITAGGPGAVAGYPRLCPGGESITSGSCPASGSVPPPPQPVIPPPSGPAYTLTAVPGAVDTTATATLGDPPGVVRYCSSDAPAGSLTPDSAVTVGGTAVTVVQVYLAMGDGLYCMETSGNPPHAPGTVNVVATNADGSKAKGTLTYASTIAAAPTVSALSPTHGPGDANTSVVISGSGFVAGAQAFIDGTMPITTTFVDAAQLRITMPLWARLGYPDYNQSSGITVANPDSAQSDALFFSFDKPVVTDVAVTNWVYSGSDVLALVCPVDPANPEFNDRWNLPPITVGAGNAFTSNDRVGISEAGGGPYLIYSTGPWPEFIGHWAATKNSSTAWGFCHEVPIPASDSAGTTIRFYGVNYTHSVAFSTATTPQGTVATTGWSGTNSCPSSSSGIRVPRGWAEC